MKNELLKWNITGSGILMVYDTKGQGFEKGGKKLK